MKRRRIKGNPYIPSSGMKDMKCPQITFTLFGRWWRIFAGVTFKWKRFRNQRFYRYRLIVVRLWGERVVGIQTRRVD